MLPYREDLSHSCLLYTSTSVGETEVGKMLPQLIDGTLTPEQFCEQLSAKAADALA